MTVNEMLFVHIC